MARGLVGQRNSHDSWYGFAMRLRIVTLNVRRDRQDDGINNWQFRRDLIAAIVHKYDPDIAAFQEVLVHQLRDLQEMLPGYRYVGVGRDDGREAGEFAPIFHRNLPVARHGTFWLSDTPERPSRTWPGMTRICTWATFAGERRFAVFNCHLEYEFEETQLNSVDLLAAKTREYAARLPLFVVGDFNLTPGSPPYAALARCSATKWRSVAIERRLPDVVAGCGFRTNRDAEEPSETDTQSCRNTGNDEHACQRLPQRGAESVQQLLCHCRTVRAA